MKKYKIYIVIFACFLFCGCASQGKKEEGKNDFLGVWQYENIFAYVDIKKDGSLFQCRKSKNGDVIVASGHFISGREVKWGWIKIYNTEGVDITHKALNGENYTWERERALIKEGKLELLGGAGTVKLKKINDVIPIECSKLKPGYSGIGGMTKYSISKEVYEYHFQTGFTGVDGMGWPYALQDIWSRVGAAEACGVDYDSELLLDYLVKKFGHTEETHKIIGYSFHRVQIDRIEGFCSVEQKGKISIFLKSQERMAKKYLGK